MTKPRVSVVVVSRQRPADLKLCLTALRQVYYRPLEIIVVADPDACAEVAGEDIRAVPFAAANISQARNAGIGASAGEIIAFIDDDAVPEPTWIDHLITPFADETVGAAGGYVLGRNGISLQWGALSVDHAGWTHPLETEGEQPLVLQRDDAHRAIRTQGTNMAMRREILRSLGGFDPAFAYYHDETDLNLRLADAGHKTAVVPRALVHHQSSASVRRRGDRVPLSLFDVGASSAVFHRKHLMGNQWAAAREDLINAQRLRLEAMLIDGRVEPKSFETLVRSLHDGYAEGLARMSGTFADIPPICNEFNDLAQPPKAHDVFSSRFLTRRIARRNAVEAVRDGRGATVLILEPTTRFHRMRFRPEGFWEQRGGLFGKTAREDPLLRPTSFSRRSAAEVQRILRFRNVIAT